MNAEFNFHLKIVVDTADDAETLRQFLLKIKGVDQIEPATAQKSVSGARVEFLLPSTHQPLTNEMLLDPNYTSEIIKTCLRTPEIMATYNESICTKLSNNLARRYRAIVPGEPWNVDGPFNVSMQQLLLMNDAILLKDVRNLGPKSVMLFRDATKHLVRKFKEVLD